MSTYFANCSGCGAGMGQHCLMDDNAEWVGEYLRSLKCDPCKQHDRLAKLIIDGIIAYLETRTVVRAAAPHAEG